MEVDVVVEVKKKKKKRKIFSAREFKVGAYTTH